MNDLDRAEIYALIRNIFRCQAQAYRDANKTIASSTWTAVDFNQTHYDHVPHRFTPIHDNALNNARLYARLTGVYAIHAQVTFAYNLVNSRILQVKQNGTSALAQLTHPAPANTCHITLSAAAFLTAGDYIELYVYQNSGGNLDLLNQAPYSPTFSLAYLGE